MCARNANIVHALVENIKAVFAAERSCPVSVQAVWEISSLNPSTGGVYFDLNERVNSGGGKMRDPRPVTRQMLGRVIEVHPDGDAPNFAHAKDAAQRAAREILAEPILIAWFDRKAWMHSPAIC